MVAEIISNLVTSRIRFYEARLTRDEFGDYKAENLRDFFLLVHYNIIVKDITALGYLNQLNNLVLGSGSQNLKEILRAYQALAIRLQGFKNFEIPCPEVIDELTSLFALAVYLFEEDRLSFKILNKAVAARGEDVYLTLLVCWAEAIQNAKIGHTNVLTQVLEDYFFDHLNPEILDFISEARSDADRLIYFLHLSQALDTVIDQLQTGRLTLDDELTVGLCQNCECLDLENDEALHNLGVLSGCVGLADLGENYLTSALRLRLERYGDSSDEVKLTREALDSLKITDDSIRQQDFNHSSDDSFRVLSEVEFLTVLEETLKNGTADKALDLVRRRRNFLQKC
ncbi:MAG: hypothetical protein NZO16_02135 [Deltaproteobacteria bacterium]|nr:hypothetical protein [Deltaproteobacteria bacterium]